MTLRPLRYLLNPAILLTTTATLFWLFVFRNFTVDDAFIGWSHGKNLVEHGVYAFNTTGIKAEGATSPLVGVFSALPIILHIDIVLFFKLLSISIIAGFIFSIWFLTKNVYRASAVILIALAGPMQAIHVWSGLETFFLVSALTILFAIVLLRPSCSVWLVSGLACLCISLRVELLFTVLVALHLFSQSASDKKTSRQAPNLTAVFAPPMLIFLIIGACRYLYFGQFVSQSSAAKTPMSSFLNLGNLLEMLLSSSKHLLGRPYELVISIVVLLLMSGTKSSYRKSFTVLFVAQTALWFVYYNSHLGMNFAHRFSYQTFWPLVLVGVVCLPTDKFRVYYFSLFIWVLTMVQIPRSEATELLTYYPRLTTSHAVVALAIKQCAAKNQWIVGNDAGIVSYLTDNYYFDVNFLGTSSVEGIEPAIERIKNGSAIVVGGSQPFAEDSTKYGSLVNETFLFARGVPGTYSPNDYVVGVRFSEPNNPHLAGALTKYAEVHQVSSLTERKQILRSILGNYWKLPKDSRLSCSD